MIQVGRRKGFNLVPNPVRYEGKADLGWCLKHFVILGSKSRSGGSSDKGVSRCSSFLSTPMTQGGWNGGGWSSHAHVALCVPRLWWERRTVRTLHIGCSFNRDMQATSEVGNSEMLKFTFSWENKGEGPEGLRHTEIEGS